MNTKIKFTLYPAIALAFLAVVFFAVVYPPFIKMEKVIKEIKYYQGVIDSSTITISDLSEIENRLAETKRELQKLEMKMPKVSQFAKVIEELAKMSSKYKITINSINPIIFDVKSEGSAKQIIKRRYIEMNFRCRFQVLGEFIEKLASIPIYATIEDITIERVDDTYPELKITLLISVYMVED